MLPHRTRERWLMKEYSTFPKAPSSLTSPSDCLVSYIQDTHCGGGDFTPLQRCSRCILQLLPIGPQGTCGRGGGSYSSAETQSVYFTAPANRATGHLWQRRRVLPLSREAVGVFYSSSRLKQHLDIHVVSSVLCMTLSHLMVGQLFWS